ncbi:MULTISPECIES: alpha/beta fold hydrolase [unclassified Amycolatopsis]|uniref:alpha/beta fold hydrolase n=1 Tax=unclassified Amycolatopsis TaxID=2618356 RepID=UPI001C6A387C|nr:alpha/beta hydrolase [Amycolatopsis sp. DSM 110486]QYN20386.1 alpha/beta hydrolase [Amycolatopsis sp. DSM 110486]
MLNRDSSWRRFLIWSAGQDIFDQPAAQVIVAGIRAYRARVPFQTCPREEDLRAIQVPVVALFGGRSVVHDPAAAAANLRTLLPHAEVDLLPEAGHYLYLRPPDRQRILGVISTARLR